MIGVMAEKVFLGGGGSAQQERSVWTAMLAGNPSILYWPMALDEDMQEDAETWLRDNLDTLGAPRRPRPDHAGSAGGLRTGYRRGARRGTRTRAGRGC